MGVFKIGEKLGKKNETFSQKSTQKGGGEIYSRKIEKIYHKRNPKFSPKKQQDVRRYFASIGKKKIEKDIRSTLV